MEAEDDLGLERDEGAEPAEGTAVVGMAGRFPGARDLGAFWENLQQGAESVTFFSAEELAAAGIDPDELADPHYVRAAPVLDGIELFDAEHFGFNPREAQVLDPQIRLFLECTWEAIEQAGYDPAACPGRVGVYAGMRMSDYLIHHVYANPEILQTVGYFQAVLGNDKDYLATLTSYKLNLTGPSLTVQSACSTSLVAIHQASEALANRECDLAVAGGVTIRLPQTSGYHYHPQGIFSPDGHCRAFEARAAGTVFGNGVGVVLLKRLEDARRDGDPVLAVIRGSAVNNDGSQKVGYTAPAVAGQARVIADALAMAGVEPAEIGYVECHGTGTALGDPIEIAALDRVFRAAPGGRACPIGSVKSNVGHLEAAAGVASFIKAVLMLKHRVRVPLAGFEAPNPRLGLDRSAFRIDTASAPWETDGGAPRRAGVSSFGIGGTNAHVVLEEAPPREASGPSRPYQLLVVSARTATALDRAGADLAAFLRQAGDVPLADVAYTLQTGRHAFSHRRIVVASGAAEAAEIFTGGAAGRLFSGSVTGAAPGVAFLFPGQGSQHVRMAEDLYRSEPVFRGEVDACCEILAPRLGCDLRTVLFPAGGEAAAQEELRQTRLAQPALFVVEHALARLLLAWGVEPQGMLGHSVGEYVAACLAGVFSRDDALALVAERGRLVQHMPPGGMLAVGLSEAAIAPSLGPGLDLAAVNGPELVTVAGPEEALAGLEGRLRAEGTDCRRLHTSHAFHSAMLEPILDLFAAAVRRVALRPPERPFLSNVTGTWIRPEEAVDPAYWVRHLRAPVRFAQGVGELLQEPRTVLLEVGPGTALATLARRSFAPGAAPPPVLSALSHPREPRHGEECLLTALGRLWLAGVAIDWPAVWRGERRQRVALPTYPFERRRHWVEALPGGHAPRVGKKKDLADWFYVPSWRRTAPPPPAGPEPAGRWWILLDREGLGERLADHLAAAAQEVVRISPGESFADVLAQSGPPRRVVHLWTYAPAPGDGEALARGFGSLLELSHLLGGGGVEISVLTRGLLEPFGTGAPDPGRAALLGACRAIPAQHPGVRCRLIDGTPEACGPEDLAAELAGEAAEPVVAWTAAGRFVPAFDAVRLPPPAAGAPGWRRGGVYALAGDGGAMAEELAAVLTEELGARVVRLAEDGEEALREAFGAAARQHGAIQGLLYVLNPEGGQPPSEVEVLARHARALGVLAELRAPLAIRCLLSPLSELREDAGGGLAAATAAMADAFAAAQGRGEGGWVSVHWEGWGAAEARFAPSREERLAALERAAAGRFAQVVISAGDLAARLAARRPAVREEPEVEAAQGLPQPAPEAAVAPGSALERTLAAIWRDLLGVEQVGRDDDFFALGGHSLLATRVLARIREACGVDLELRDLFDHPTLAGLAQAVAAAQSAGRPAVALPPIERAPRDGDLPLSSPQERLWFLQRMSPADPSYNLAGSFPVAGSFSLGSLAGGLGELVRRHEILRTVFPERDGRAVQVVLPPRPFNLPLADLAALPDPVRSAEARRLARQEAVTVFDLAHGPLFRGLVLRLGAQEHLLLLTLHHIVADGWSFGVFERESTAATRPELPIQYADYAVWQRRWMEGEGAEKLLAYWRQKLAGVPPLLALPLDIPRTAERRPWGARGRLALDRDTSQALRRLARAESATPFMVLLAVFEILLLVETEQRDFVIGTDVANRRPGTENLIGLFVNQIVLRSDLAGDPTFRELLGRVRRTALDAFAHQELPFERLIKELSPERDRRYNPVFQVLFLFQTNPLPEAEVTAGGGEGELARVAAPHDLKVELQEAGDEFRGGIEARLDLFKPQSVRRLIERYRELAAAVAARPDARLSDLVREAGAAERARRQETRQDLKSAGLSLLRQRRRT